MEMQHRSVTTEAGYRHAFGDWNPPQRHVRVRIEADRFRSATARLRSSLEARAAVFVFAFDLSLY
jgi:hypothetical protein